MTKKQFEMFYLKFEQTNKHQIYGGIIRMSVKIKRFSYKFDVESAKVALESAWKDQREESERAKVWNDSWNG